MPGEQIINVGHVSISFNRCSTNIIVGCTFCKQPTYRALAHRRAIDPNWEILPICDPCMSGIQKMPVTSDDKSVG